MYRLPLLLIASALLLVGGAAPFAAEVARADTPATVFSENQLPGSVGWKPVGSNLPNSNLLNGYAEQSVLPGETLHLHVGTTPAASYRVDIFRLGYYQGLGGRVVACLPSCSGSKAGVPLPVTTPDPATGLNAAGWPVTDEWQVPADAQSGVYVAHLVLRSGSNVNKSLNVPFVVRSLISRPVLVTASVNTWQAYNNWGSRSLYPFNSVNRKAAVKVSFDRPMASDRNSLAYEQPMLAWLEQQGYDAEYTTDLDVDADPAGLLAHRLVIINGHSEYWSRPMRDALVTARDAGVNLAFVGGNQGWGHVRYEDDRRTLVYYENARRQADDPDPDTATSWKELGEPECALLGVGYNGGLKSNATAKPLVATSAAASDPWFAGTGITPGFSLTSKALGHEWNQIVPGCASGIVSLFHAGGSKPADVTRYTASSGARVLAVGTLGFVKMLGGAAGGFLRNALDDLSGGA